MEPNSDLLELRLSGNVSISVNKIYTLAKWAFFFGLFYWLLSQTLFIVRYSFIYKTNGEEGFRDVWERVILPVLECFQFVFGVTNTVIFLRFVKIFRAGIITKDQHQFESCLTLFYRSLTLSVIQFFLGIPVYIYYLYEYWKLYKTI